jgi:hypothetical protein
MDRPYKNILFKSFFIFCILSYACNSVQSNEIRDKDIEDMENNVDKEVITNLVQRERVRSIVPVEGDRGGAEALMAIKDFDNFALRNELVPNATESATTESTNNLTFSPPWYVHSHHQSLIDPQVQQRITDTGLSYYQLWIWHLFPFLSGDFHENTFPYNCEFKDIKSGSCEKYNEALNAINNIGVPVSVEFPLTLYLDHARKYYPNKTDQEICSSLDPSEARVYGRKTAELYFTYAFENWLRLGGRIDHISLDGLILKLTKGLLYDCGFPNVENSIQATISLVKKWQNLFSQWQQNPEFSILVNFPDWNYDGMPSNGRETNSPDYKNVLNRLVELGNERGVKFKYLVIDAPYPFYVVHGKVQTTYSAMARTDRLIMQARQLGLKISYIANTHVAHIEPKYYPLEYDEYENWAYKSDSLVYLDTLRYRYGDLINNYVVQSWHVQPYSYIDMVELLENFNSRNLFYPPAIGSECSVHDYLSLRPDVRASGMSALEHYQNAGINENMCKPPGG